MHNLTVSVETIEPQQANELLERNLCNRAIIPATVEKYAAEMKSQKWDLNGESIVIDQNGNLLNGQHRLRAVVQTGIALVVVVVRGVKPEAFKTLDTGRNRTGRDLLTIAGLRQDLARTVAAAASKCILFETSGKMTSQRHYTHLVTPARCHEYATKHARLIEIADSVLGLRMRTKLLAASMVTALWFLMEKKAYHQSSEFFLGLLTGANLHEHDPRLVLRQKLERQLAERLKWNAHTKARATIRAWHWYVRGKDCPHPHNMLQGFDTAMDLLKEP
jgi:hypothetical protein